MKTTLASLFNRIFNPPKAQNEMINGTAFEPTAQDRLGDPLSGLLPITIDRDWRWRINRGEYTAPAWALYNAALLMPIIGDKLSFWSASLAGMDYDIRQSEEIKRNPALKAKADLQKAALELAYSKQKMPTIFKHLSLARFYGYSVLSRTEQLEPLDWWNVLRDGLHGDFFWNPDCRVSTARQMPEENRMTADRFIIRECDDALILKCLRIYQRAVDVESWWDENLEQESRRQVVVLTGNPPSNKATDYLAAAKNIANGRSGMISKGPTDNSTEVIFPPASRGLQFYEARLNGLDAQLTKSLTGSTLSTLTSPGSGTLAGNAHQDTMLSILSAEAGEISETLQEQFDKPALIKAGLLEVGESPLAYFSMRTSKATDPALEVAWTQQLAAAGWKRERAELSERVGMQLAPIDPPPIQIGYQPQPARPVESQPVEKPIIEPIANREEPQPKENTMADAIGIPAAWLEPVKAMLDALESDALDSKLSDADLKKRIQSVIDSLPEVFEKMDHGALADVMSKTIKESIKGA